MLDQLCKVVAVHLSVALKFLSRVAGEILIYLKPWRPADNWEGLLRMPVIT
jgi:hypothetical protein